MFVNAIYKLNKRAVIKNKKQKNIKKIGFIIFLFDRTY